MDHPTSPSQQPVLDRELEYHEKLYSGFAQQHFAKPAVRALRRHMVRRILDRTGAGPRSRILSLGCGIGDTELLLAAHTGPIVGVDLSPSAIRQANADAARLGILNFEARETPYEQLEGQFDAIVAIFFLHHLTDEMLAACAAKVHSLLAPGGVFYSLDPSRYRLSGFVGELLFPKLMARYQTDDERQLAPAFARGFFERQGGFESVETSFYDYVSTPLAGLFPSWASGYRAARVADEALIRLPLVRLAASNFEITARRRPAAG